MMNFAHHRKKAKLSWLQSTYMARTICEVLCDSDKVRIDVEHYLLNVKGRLGALPKPHLLTRSLSAKGNFDKFIYRN